MDFKEYLNVTNYLPKYFDEEPENMNRNETFQNDCIFDVALNILHVYYIPILITVGLIGNLTSVFVFMTTHLKLHSSSYYLASLAIVEFLFVVILLIVRFSFNSENDLFNKNGWCQLFVYMSSVCTTLSAWLIVAFTVERFIAVQYPLQRPHICTVSRAKIIVLGLVLIGLLSQSYIFWTAGIIKSEDYDICELKPEYKDVMKIINIFDTILTLIGPTLLIIIMNIMIARNIYLFKRRIKRKVGERDSDHDGVFLEMSISKVNNYSCFCLFLLCLPCGYNKLLLIWIGANMLKVTC